jgi:hypothetical protein
VAHLKVLDDVGGGIDNGRDGSSRHGIPASSSMLGIPTSLFWGSEATLHKQ